VILKMKFTDILAGDSRETFPERFAALKRHGSVMDVEYDWRRKDGSVFPVLLNATAIFDTEGNYVASRATVFDLTERKRAEEERERFFTLSRDLLCIAGTDGYFKRVNPSWEQTLGHNEEELLARPYVDFVHPDDLERTISEGMNLATGRETIGFENRFRCKDGSYRWLRWNARSAPAQRLIYASAQDVTEQRANAERILWLNADLATRAAQLEIANRELESFSYSVSHDLRAPLRHIDGFANLLSQHANEALSAEARRYITIISRSAKQMGVLIDDLLAFSRFGRGQLTLALVNQEKLVAEVIGNGSYDTESRRIAWQVGPLPSVRGDASMLRQVWVNLIDNAVKYSSRVPEPRIEIACREERERPEYVFFVRDNGIGFEMAYADKLFGVFQRLHTAAEFEGTGIGLANVRRIIARHGGRTWAEGSPGQGACFYFSLPIAVSSSGSSS
jgi:PAS domain S-box-containing protein